MRLISLFTITICVGAPCSAFAFTSLSNRAFAVVRQSPTLLLATREQVTAPTFDFIEKELRGAAMKLHTRSQAPKEGQAEEEAPQEEPYITTHADYLQFLVDSKHVYEAMEEIVNEQDELKMFRNTGLERTIPLEKDIQFMCQEYGLERPPVGVFGETYANELRRIAKDGSIPEFICHYYNFYMAHTAGGRMIGKQMAALLLNKKTLEFYKWDGDLNELKNAVKQNIEEMVSGWTREEKDECINATAEAFRGGGMINANLSGKRG